MFASSKAKEIVQSTKEKKQIQALENNRDLDDVDLKLNLKEARQVVEVVRSQRTARKIDQEARKLIDKSPPKKQISTDSKLRS